MVSSGGSPREVSGRPRSPKVQKGEQTVMITRHDVATRVTEYLHHNRTLEELVEWAEEVMMEGEVDKRDSEVLRAVIGRLGLANVKEFGLTWEDCEDLLSRLGYQVKVQIIETSRQQ